MALVRAYASPVGADRESLLVVFLGDFFLVVGVVLGAKPPGTGDAQWVASPLAACGWTALLFVLGFVGEFVVFLETFLVGGVLLG